jgi:hypothetical protein
VFFLGGVLEYWIACQRLQKLKGWVFSIFHYAIAPVLSGYGPEELIAYL